MALTVFSKRQPADDAWSVDINDNATHEVSFIVDQTDSGPLADGVAVAAAAQLLASDPVPLRGEQYSYHGYTDADSFCQNISGRRPEPKTKPKRWIITANFSPLNGIDPDRLTEPDPLMWPVEYWVDWVEEQVPVEEADVVEDLSHVGRAAGSSGPPINAAGQEFTEPLLKTIYYPVLNCQKPYETLNEIIALNTTYQDTTNNGTFFGAATRKAKYLTTESGRLQQVNGQAFYMGITRIWFKDSTWDRKLLNNGWGHLVADGGTASGYVEDGDNNPKVHINKVYDPNEDDAEPAEPASEPMNLAADGTLLPSDTAAVYLTYRDLEEVDYSGIGIGGT